MIGSLALGVFKLRRFIPMWSLQARHESKEKITEVVEEVEVTEKVAPIGTERRTLAFSTN